MRDIADALFLHLQAANLGAIAWPGVRFDPPAAGYLAVSLFPLPARAATVTTHDRIDGLMQVSVFAPAGTGVGAALVRAQAVVDRFARGTVMRDGEREVRIIRPPFIAAPVQEAGWLQIPVTVPWTAFVRVSEPVVVPVTWVPFKPAGSTGLTTADGQEFLVRAA